MTQIVLALDDMTLDQALNLVANVGDRIYAVKGHSLFEEYGLSTIRELKDVGARRVWVDAKLHDIPNTVKLRARAIAKAGADIITVHASGEIEMMMAALEGGGSAEIYAITVLTSLNEEQAHLLHGQPSKAGALYLARLAKLAGVHGVVCSPKEVGILAKRPELQGLKLVVPGSRSPGKEAGDQKRVDTPANASTSGATHLVIGRQVTQAEDPVEGLRQIEAEVTSALALPAKT